MTIQLKQLYQSGSDLFLSIRESNAVGLLDAKGRPIVKLYNFLSLPDCKVVTFSESQVKWIDPEDLLARIKIKDMMIPQTGERYCELGAFSVVDSNGATLISGEGKAQWEEINMSEWIETYLRTSKLVTIE